MAKHLAHRFQTALALRGSFEDPSSTGVRILAYHRICEGPDDLAVAPATFRRQMEIVRSSSARPAGLVEAVEALRQEPVEHLVCVTFDDGYRDNLEHAIPVLREFGIPATFYVASAMIDGAVSAYWYPSGREPRLLTWDEIAELDRDPLFEIGAHTRTHPALTMLSEAEAREEIEGSKRDLEERLGHPVLTFSYPAGLYGARERKLVRAAGFVAAVTTAPGLNLSDRPHEALHRMFVDGYDTERMFEAKLAGLLDRPWGLDTVREMRSRLV